jgi:hypothetical protein
VAPKNPGQTAFRYPLRHFSVRNIASGSSIGLPGQIVAGLLPEAGLGRSGPVWAGLGRSSFLGVDVGFWAGLLIERR